MTKNEELLEDENINLEEDVADTDDTEVDETDYKMLYEDEKRRSETYEGRFKKTAKQLNELKKTSNKSEITDVSEMVSKQVQEELYYANNPVAKEYKNEIKEVQSQYGLSAEDAMTFYLAKNKPELISKKSSNTGVDGVSQSIEAEKDYKDMTEEELREAKG